MSEISSKQLITINLRYGSTAKSIKTLSYANLVAKVLFLHGNAKFVEDISKSVAKLIGVKAISIELIELGIAELKNDNRVSVSKNKWSLSKETREEMLKETEAYDVSLNEVLSRNFSKKIDVEKLKIWFVDALVDFFDYNGEEWVQSVCKGPHKVSKKNKTLGEILVKSIESNSLNEYVESLSNSFHGFLASDNIDDQKFLSGIGYAMFSSRLVAADIGADPITLEELKGAIFLIDTNFLFALHLESHRFAASLEALGKALKFIDAKILYIDETSKEYERVWTGRRAQILKLLKLYPEEVVKDADDDFITTAVFRGANTIEDFETFFKSIYKIPKCIPEGPDIKKLEFADINTTVANAKKDEALKTSIQNWCIKFRPFWNRYPKSLMALNHDAAIIHVAEKENKENKTFILTLDRSLQACAADRVGPHEIPRAIYLEGLIQILAANNAGPEFDSTNFAPLMSNILLKRCIPPERTYNSQDLYWLYGIQKNVAQFKPGKIKQIALEVTKARLSGKSADDSELQRTVNRLYQEEIKNTDQKVEEFADRTKEAERVAEVEKGKRQDIEAELVGLDKKEKLRIAKNKLVKSLIWRIPLALILSVLAYFIIAISFGDLEKQNLLSFSASIVALIGSGFTFLSTPIKKYKKVKESL